MRDVYPNGDCEKGLLMKARIQKLMERFSEVEKLLGEPDVLSDQKRYKELAQEHSYLSEIKDFWTVYEKILKQLKENKTLIQEETDPELVEIAREEVESLEKEAVVAKTKIETLLVPADPDDHRNTILEVRAGIGGDEAALFCRRHGANVSSLCCRYWLEVGTSFCNSSRSGWI